MEEKILEKIAFYLKVPFDEKNMEELMKVSYLDEGYIDSFGMIQMILGLEEEFNIKFSEEELLSQEIKTVKGLVNLVKEKIGY